MSSDSDSDEDVFDRRNKASRRDPPRELEDASDVDEDDEDLDAILQPGRYKVKATTQPTSAATAAKQMSREELMGEIYGKKAPRGRKRKADSVPAPKTTVNSKRTGDEPSAIEPDSLDDEPSATVGSVLKRSRPTATSAKGKDVLPVDTSIVLSDSDEDDLELEHLHYDDAPMMNLNSFSEMSAYLPPAVVESLRLARESQAIASRLRQSDPLYDSPIRSTSTTSSSARPSSSPAAAVLLSLLCPLTSEVMKFRILKSQPFSLLLNEYIKKKKEPLNTYLRRHSMTEYLSDHKKLLEDDGGFVVKFDGMPVQPSQTPQDFGMLENETLQLALPPPPSSWMGDLEKEVGLRLSSRTLPTPQPASVQLDDEGAEEEEEEADADYVILRLRREGQEEKFRIDQDKQFQKLHDSYCQKKRLIPEKVKFIFDGLPLNMRSTPANEDMEDDDIVDVKVEPGAQLPAVAASTAAAATTTIATATATASKPQPPRPAPVATYVEDDDDDSAYVLLRVRRGTEEDKFRIKRSDPFKKLQEAYCKKKGLKMAEARFVFDGLPLKGNQTAEGQDMEDEDIIDVEDNK